MSEDPRDDDQTPSGLPPGEPEEEPLGVPRPAQPESEPARGPDAMPGIPTRGEPPDAG